MGAREKQKAKSRAARNTSGKSTPSSAKFNKYTHKGLTPRSTVQDWQSFASTPYSSSPQNGHSLVQEARNTERHTFGWGNSRLRDNAVAFVSAGNLIREEAQVSSEDQEDDNVDKPAATVELSAEEEPDATVVFAAQADVVSAEIVTAQPDVVQNDDSPGSADRQDESSSEDEIVFHGRKGDNPPAHKSQSPHVAQSSIKQPIPVPIPRSPEVLTHPPMSSLSDAPVTTNNRSSPTQRPRRRWETRYDQRRLQEQEEEDAILQDYIENMAMDDDDDEDEDDEENKAGVTKTAKPHRRNEHFRFHKGDGLDNAKVQLKTTQTATKQIIQAKQDDWDSADLDDLNDISTTDDDEEFELDRVLRHRDRPKGRQYLVTAVGKEISDAKWIPHAKLTTQAAVQQIAVYEVMLGERLQESVDESTEEDEDEEDLIDDIGSEQDENERIIERTSRMTDEQIARALAKQEELGLGSDEVMLWNDQDMDDLDDDNDFTIDEFMSGNGFIPFSMSKHTSNRGRSKRNKRGRDSFPSAEALADAVEQDPYGGFDVMDFDRPSLRPKRKGRKSDFPYDVDGIDDDLAEQLMNTWTKDREKKAARKREKEEERETFLIESAEGSNPAVIKARIRQFLVSESDSLELTPMDAHVRASVHRLAKALKLNSQSRGKDGKAGGRYPVLTKTPYTPYYDIDTIWEVDALMNLRKFFPKAAYKEAKALRPTPASRGGRGGVAAASYANGEVVGAAAPEIGIENRGRAMLEKMGWSAGMGIGAVGNKGSIDAIKHVVKTNKAGLG